MSPRKSHKSTIARNPTRKTTNTPTNFTLTEQASIAPFRKSQIHQDTLNELHHMNKRIRTEITICDDISIQIHILVLITVVVCSEILPSRRPMQK